MKDLHKDCKWQTKVEMDKPTNPLQALAESFARTSKDMAQSKFDAWHYGVILGWDADALAELKVIHKWSDEEVEYQKQLHQNFIKAWNLFIEHENYIPL